MKVVVGLGNPGLRYDDTRHNVGWWVVDRLAYDWGFGSFEKEGRSLRTGGSVGDASVLLIKPTTFMNRSGVALVGVDGLEECDFGSDLLLVVDDATLDVGRVRFRPREQTSVRLDIRLVDFHRNLVRHRPAVGYKIA